MDSAEPSLDKMSVNGDAQMGWDELNSLLHTHTTALFIINDTADIFLSSGTE